MTSSIISGIEAVAEAEAEIQKLEAQERSAAGKVARAMAEHREALAAWQQRSAKAFEAGKKVEPAPEEPPAREVGDRLRRDLRAKIEKARTERLRAIVAAAELVDEEAERIVREGLEAATPLVASLEAIVSQVASAQTAVRQVRDAANSLDSYKSVHPSNPTRVDLPGLVQAVKHAEQIDLLAGHRTEGRHLGMQEGATWATAEPPPERPLLPPPAEPSMKGILPSPRGGFQRAEPRLP